MLPTAGVACTPPPGFPLQELHVLHLQLPTAGGALLHPQLPILMTFKVHLLSLLMLTSYVLKFSTFRPTEAFLIHAHTVVRGSGVQGQPETPGEFLSERPGESVGDNSVPLQTAGCTPRHGLLGAEPWCAVLSWGHTPVMTCELGTVRSAL